MIQRIREELHLLRHDFWASRHSGAILILGFGIVWGVLIVILI